MIKADDDVALLQAQRRLSALSDAIVRSEGELKAVGARLQQEKAELRRVQRFIDSWHDLAGRIDATTAVERQKNPDRREVASLALAEIRRAGRPILRRDLFQRLLNGGLSLAGKDPEIVFGTMLYRDERIVRLRGHGYWDAGAVYEPAFYWPEHENVVGASDKDEIGDAGGGD